MRTITKQKHAANTNEIRNINLDPIVLNIKLCKKNVQFFRPKIATESVE
jgi:hypothetical protein